MGDQQLFEIGHGPGGKMGICQIYKVPALKSRVIAVWLNRLRNIIVFSFSSLEIWGPDGHWVATKLHKKLSWCVNGAYNLSVMA